MSKFSLNPEITIGNVLTVLAIVFTVLVTQIRINESVTTLQAKQTQLEQTLTTTQQKQLQEIRELQTSVDETYVRKDYLEAVLDGINRILDKLERIDRQTRDAP